MTSSGERMRVITNWKPRPRISILARNLRLGDYVEGERVVWLDAGEVFMHYRTQGNPHTQGWRSDFPMEIERE